MKNTSSKQYKAFVKEANTNLIKNILGAQTALGLLIGTNPLSGVGAGSTLALDDSEDDDAWNVVLLSH